MAKKAKNSQDTLDTSGSYLLRKNAGVSDWIFSITIWVLLFAVVAVVAYPLYFVVIASFSDPVDVGMGRTLLAPVGIYLEGYEEIFRYDRLWTAYGNTIFYTVAGTVLHLLLTIPIAYTISRKGLMLNGFLATFLIITMFFNGGTIPLYMMLRAYGLLNTRWVLIVSGCVSVYNIIIARTFFANSIPAELMEAAEIDGATALQTFVKIVLPISMTIIAVIGLYAAVGYWNAYKPGLMYIRNDELFPLQVILRELLLVNMNDMMVVGNGEVDQMRKAEQIKYGIIVVSTLPIMCLYPMLQRFFAKGVMIGAVKG